MWSTISVVVLLPGSGITFRQSCLYQHQTGIVSFRLPVKRTCQTRAVTPALYFNTNTHICVYFSGSQRCLCGFEGLRGFNLMLLYHFCLITVRQSQTLLEQPQWAQLEVYIYEVSLEYLILCPNMQYFCILMLQIRWSDFFVLPGIRFSSWQLCLFTSGYYITGMYFIFMKCV